MCVPLQPIIFSKVKRIIGLMDCNRTEKSTKPFVLRVYGRTELACLYCPNITPGAAWRKLKLWIDTNQELTVHLHRLGYDGRRRSFTIAQVRAIIRLLGDPE